MDPLYIFSMILIGMGAGMFAGMFGIGGSIVILPILVIVFH